MHLIDREGNDTSSLYSIYDMRRNRMVVDYETNRVTFKDNPEVWPTLPTTKKGLMMIPLTKEACDRHSSQIQYDAQLAYHTDTSNTQPSEPSTDVLPPPTPTVLRPKGRRSKRQKYTSEAFDWYTC